MPSGPLFFAHYPGRCTDCLEPFQEGDVIGYTDDEIRCEDCHMGDYE